MSLPIWANGPLSGASIPILMEPCAKPGEAPRSSPATARRKHVTRTLRPFLVDVTDRPPLPISGQGIDVLQNRLLAAQLVDTGTDDHQLHPGLAIDVQLLPALSGRPEDDKGRDDVLGEEAVRLPH